MDLDVYSTWVDDTSIQSIPSDLHFPTITKRHTCTYTHIDHIFSGCLFFLLLGSFIWLVSSGFIEVSVTRGDRNLNSTRGPCSCPIARPKPLSLYVFDTQELDHGRYRNQDRAILLLIESFTHHLIYFITNYESFHWLCIVRNLFTEEE